MRETRAALEVGAAWGWLDDAEAKTADEQLDRVAAATYRLLQR